jgi:hypothetical protein
MTSKSATRPKDGDEVNPKIDLAPNSNTEKSRTTGFRAVTR